MTRTETPADVRQDILELDLYGNLYTMADAYCAGCRDTGPVKIILEPVRRHFCLMCGETSWPDREAA